MARLSSLLGLGLALHCRASEAGPRHDAAALVQSSVHTHRADQDASSTLEVSSAVRETSQGPVAQTKLGPILGQDKGSYNLFGGVPYAETPVRFEEAQPKKPWAPKTLEATQFQHACIGAGTGDPESEDCLFLNIWIPKGGHKNMPVVVYFHGGINQHGSGFEALRRGDAITQSEKFPTIFINFDFRMGIFGWMSIPGSNYTGNLGLHDQQAALRWVQDHISAFGGDPSRVTLQGQSEGSGIILVHMVSPGSKGLFSRAAFHSPVADFWTRSTNVDRTKFMVTRMGCARRKTWSTVRCLQRKSARQLWEADWVSEELSRGVGGPLWWRNFIGLASFALKAKDKEDVIGELGWHAVVDGVTVPAEPRDLLREGKFNKVPVLITVSKNESYGVVPNGLPDVAELGMKRLLQKGDEDRVKYMYWKTLSAQGINVSQSELMNEILTDKLWTCDARSLADDIITGGGRAHLGMFWHSPKYDYVGTMTSPICNKGATCHAAEMLYVLPQGEGHGIHGPGMEEEIKFSKKYSDYFLAFVHGEDKQHPWKAWDSTRPMTFVDSHGSRVVPDYRKEQCAVLDSSMGDHLPDFMRRLARQSPL